jgi:hypothetical protein
MIGALNLTDPHTRTAPMAHSTHGRVRRQLHPLRAAFAQQPGLPFADLLPDDTAERLGPAAEPVYTPLVTLGMFLSQVLDPVGSCRQAVARLLAWLSSTGQPPCAAGTGAYCKARQRPREDALRDLARHTGRTLHARAAAAWHWQGRRVLVADGTTLTMPDTAANQAAYPQPDGQKPGLGFPMIRMVALFCLATGAVLDAAFCPYRGKGTGELALLRRVWDTLAPGDVLLGDRLSCSYFEIALLGRRRIDVVFRKHQSRRTDFRTGTRLGRNDHRIRWSKPARPDWLDADAYEALPASLSVREVRVRVAQPGFRVRRFEAVATLLDPAAVSVDALGQLYRRRWHAELDLRAVKQSMGLERLRCQTPPMVRKELWTYLLAYNLVRGVMAQAAWAAGVPPRCLSFAGAAQTVRSFGPELGREGTDVGSECWAALWAAIATHRVGNRPDRVEPRAVKRRRRDYPALTRPRHDARQHLLDKM